MKRKTRFKRSEYEIHDADTILLKRKIGDLEFVRLQGFNAPERWEEGYTQAMKDLKRILNNRPITVHTKAVNQNRIIGRVRVGRKDVTVQMKKKGW